MMSAIIYKDEVKTPSALSRNWGKLTTFLVLTGAGLANSYLVNHTITSDDVSNTLIMSIVLTAIALFIYNKVMGPDEEPAATVSSPDSQNVANIGAKIGVFVLFVIMLAAIINVPQIGLPALLIFQIHTWRKKKAAKKTNSKTPVVWSFTEEDMAWYNEDEEDEYEEALNSARRRCVYLYTIGERLSPRQYSHLSREVVEEINDETFDYLQHLGYEFGGRDNIERVERHIISLTRGR